MATTEAELEARHAHDLADEDNVGVPFTNAKFGMWMFLSSDFLFFAGFIGAFLLYRDRPQAGVTLFDVVDIPFTSATSFVLLMSSLTMVLGLAAIRRGDHRRLRLWLVMTALFGMIFIAGQIFEFTQFYREGFTLDGNLNGSTFFVLTGLHGIHVTIGIIWLATLWFLSVQKRITTADEQKIEIAGMYWHFVDVIWIVIFMLIYLVPAPG